MRRARSRSGVRDVAALALAMTPALILLLGAVRPARADYTLQQSNQPTGHYHSPQDFAVQVTFGPYRPDVDSEFSSGRHPYADYFGDGRNLLSQAQFDYQVFHKLGTAAVGLGAGYFRVSGFSPVASNPALTSGDKSTLTVVPVSLSAVYRFDYYLERDGFPIVPHAKLGLDWAYWQITDGNGEIARAAGGRARGGTLGWHGALGVALVLDFLDPMAARDFDVELGVNHTALVFEFGHYDISGLGRANRLHLGDNTWTLGLLFEF
ncbi:MAG TPA: MXAN_2562 family outer membrane beta-barrel protein [Polyangia bacterium]|nr:MXAN_2562 family outer membrane beta-barrel protein [Polyangia bacterium]